VMDGMKKMYQDNEDAIYYITCENDNYVMPAMDDPERVTEGIIRGMYELKKEVVDGAEHHVQLLGSGAILNSSLAAQQLLAENYGISSTVWSVTSYTELARDAQATERFNRLHPTKKPKTSYLEDLIADIEGPFISSSDYVRAVSEQISPWIPGGLYALGTDGMGRSETREALRRHFEVDAESIVIATLYKLSLLGKLPRKRVDEAIKSFEYDREKIDPYFA
jgi:pyruvate dehydrogenase E1 component